jgi:hypothetical protein
VDSRVLEAFAATWPIFRAQEVVRRRLASITASREEHRQVLLAQNVEHEPLCWSTHSGSPPADWCHTLYALYRVRCNLFHGQKSMHVENDVEIVKCAADVLLPAVDALMSYAM